MVRSEKSLLHLCLSQHRVWSQKAFLWVTSVNVPKRPCSHKHVWGSLFDRKEKLLDPLGDLVSAPKAGERFSHSPPRRRNKTTPRQTSQHPGAPGTRCPHLPAVLAPFGWHICAIRVRYNLHRGLDSSWFVVFILLSNAHTYFWFFYATHLQKWKEHWTEESWSASGPPASFCTCPSVPKTQAALEHAWCFIGGHVTNSYSFHLAGSWFRVSSLSLPWLYDSMRTTVLTQDSLWS